MYFFIRFSDTSDISVPTHINLQHAKDKIQEAEKLFLEDKMVEVPNSEIIDKPGSTIKPIVAQREQISNKLGSLNEAMALLLQAMLGKTFKYDGLNLWQLNYQSY